MTEKRYTPVIGGLAFSPKAQREEIQGFAYAMAFFRKSGMQ